MADPPVSALKMSELHRIIQEDDTIAAIATAPGEAGIGILRVSGPDAPRLALSLFRSPSGSPVEGAVSHRANYGRFVDPATGEQIDDGLLTLFRAPHSYTGEEVAELSCHGSPVVLGQLLQLLFRGGARPAEPGEFTRRAFLHGRLDLAEAEAVIDLIRARTRAAARVALSQREGRLSRLVRELRVQLIDLLAEIEASIDFPDDVEPVPSEELGQRLAAVRDQVRDILSTAEAGRLYREGAVVVLAGEPNCGKSSLLNALLGEDRAIVTEIPGTTRDLLEEPFNLDGIPVKLVDTAGLRSTGDPVEKIGVERARRQVEQADLVLWLVDSSRPAAPSSPPELPPGQAPCQLLLSKSDLPRRLPEACLAALDPGSRALPISSLTGEGLDALRRRMLELLPGAGLAPDSVLVAGARQQLQLEQAAASLERAVEASSSDFDQVAVSLDIRQAAEALGEITGETVTEETISRIFARFCVGK